MSFVHKTGENVEHNLTFYAFTYPFTYTEQQDNLELYERKFGKQNEELDLIARELNVPKKDKLVIKINDKINFQQEFKGGNCSDSNDFETELVDKDDFYAMNENATDEVCFKEFVRASESKRSSTLIDENTSESMQQITNLVNNVKIELPGNSNELTCNMACTSKSFQQLEMKTRMDAIKDDIYYYNELLIHSYEGRRIDLVTITSFQGMQVTREERLKNLFPDYNKARCHTFKDKKVHLFALNILQFCSNIYL